ncbi:hypothetical protein ACFL1D_05530 [Candidatus Omnitrophota bacterium]
MRSLALFLSSLVLAFILSGCVTMPTGQSAVEDLQPSASLGVNDVPVPAGFTILEDKSFISQNAGMRAGILRYTGVADAENVVSFYKNQMPVHNWVLLNILEYGEQMLNFERENEICLITITPRRGRVWISISLAPKSPMSVQNREMAAEEAIGITPSGPGK